MEVYDTADAEETGPTNMDEQLLRNLRKAPPQK
jgi:hypothetical protein